jgi:DNA modification methylase
MTDAPAWRVIVGDARERLADLEPESVQTCVTSPPYFGLRDYGEPAQIGLEASPAEYVAEVVAVLEGVRRVLRPDGTLWLNLGDSYAGTGGAGGVTSPLFAL